mmetsp:Transcript_29155/g.93002  ORF Transcript_29155/g.93002 Transcript_29155/m.93002 type:complete len:245 (-) Transcript_29155:1219-1953(-)
MKQDVLVPMTPEDRQPRARRLRELGQQVLEEHQAAEGDHPGQALRVGHRSQERQGSTLRETAQHHPLGRHALFRQLGDGGVHTPAGIQGVLHGATVSVCRVRHGERQRVHVEPAGHLLHIAGHVLLGRARQEEAAGAGAHPQRQAALQHAAPALLRVAQAVHPHHAAARLANRPHEGRALAQDFLGPRRDHRRRLLGAQQLHGLQHPEVAPLHVLGLVARGHEAHGHRVAPRLRDVLDDVGLET